jgi:hypothetical protein
MTTVRTLCPNCDHEVDVRSPEILLMARDDEEEGTYAFLCPDCETLQDKPAPKKITLLLIAAGEPSGHSAR